MHAHAAALPPLATDRTGEDSENSIGPVVVATVWLVFYVAAAAHSLVFGG